MITPKRMMYLLQESPDGIDTDAADLVDVALAWKHGREMEALEILYPTQTDLWRLVLLTDWESQGRYVVDPENGFDHSWDTVKQFLRDVYPQYVTHPTEFYRWGSYC